MRVERSTKDQIVSRLAALVKAKERNKNSGLKKPMDAEEKDFNEIVNTKDEELRRNIEERKRARKERKKKKKERLKAEAEMLGHKSEVSTPEDETLAVEERTGDGVDPNIAMMMGFSGFGASNNIR